MSRLLQADSEWIAEQVRAIWKQLCEQLACDEPLDSTAKHSLKELLDEVNQRKQFSVWKGQLPTWLERNMELVYCILE